MTHPNTDCSFCLNIAHRSNTTVTDRPNELVWYSLDGLPNKGRVVFNLSADPPLLSGVNEQTLMTLTISYDLPEVAVKVFESLGTKLCSCGLLPN